MGDTRSQLAALVEDEPELLAAAQAIDLLAPLRTSAALSAVHGAIRGVVPMLVADRPPAPDIDAISALVEDGSLERACPFALA